MRLKYKKLGEFIRLIDERNSDGLFSEDELYGISVTKEFIVSHANLVGVTFDGYKVVAPRQFAYIPDTSRRGEKIAISLNTTVEKIIVSSICTVFEVINNEQLLPEFLMLWFMRPEFDRYARFMSNGSAREVFDWDCMCGVELPVPSVEEQWKIVRGHQTISERIKLLRQINDNLWAHAQTYFNSLFLTESGALNDEWKTAFVGDYCADNTANLSKDDGFETILYLDTGSVTQNFISSLQELNLSVDDIPSRAKRKVSNGDIVYSTVRPNLKHYALIQNPPCNLIVSTGFAVLKNKGYGVSNELIFMWLTKDSVLEYLQAIAENSVSTYPSINVSDLLNVEIRVPDDNTLDRTNCFLKVIFSAINDNNNQVKALLDLQAILLRQLTSSR